MSNKSEKEKSNSRSKKSYFAQDNLSLESNFYSFENQSHPQYLIFI